MQVESRQVDWSDLGQVVDAWERAKQVIRDRLDEDKTGPEFLRIITEVVESGDLPGAWEDRLEHAIRAEGPVVGLAF